MTRPVHFFWDGESMTPATQYQAKLADAEYVVGESYTLTVQEDRSMASHNHQFAWLKQAWLSLPEHLQAAPFAQSRDHLRKYALIRTGFCDIRTVTCGSNAAAQRVALMARDLDHFCVADIAGSTVTVMTAHSQSTRAMGKQRFQESKTAILEFIADLIGVTPENLQQQKDAA